MSIAPKSGRSVRRASSAICPASSTPVGPPPTTAKVIQASRSSGSAASSARSKAPSTRERTRRASASDLSGGASAAHSSGRGAARARGDDQRVVAEPERLAVRAGGVHGARVEVEAADLGEQHAGVVLPAQDAAQRRRDLGLGEDARRHLVEQRLEQVVVGAVDQRDLDRRAAQRARGGQAAEAAADDQDAVGRVAVRGSSSHDRRFYAPVLRHP